MTHYIRRKFINSPFSGYHRRGAGESMIVRERSSFLLGIFNTIGERIDINSFNGRLRVQKIVYLLQGHPEFRKYLRFHFSMYFHGPYSPELAFVYYNELKGTTPARVLLSKEALDYATEITSMSTEDLEILATLAEAMRVNRGRADDEEIVDMVHELKPIFSREKISELLDHLRYLKVKYGLSW